ADTCDAALLLLALTYVVDPAAVLREAARILKRGGKLVIVDLLPHARDDFRRQLGQRSLGLAEPTMTDLLTSTGFTVKQVRPLPPEPNAKGPALFLAVATKL